MPAIFLVMIGGALGAGARHLTGRAMLTLLGPGFPWGTLTVNLVGGLAMGLLAGVLPRVGGPGEAWRLFVGVGLLGGYTTFSAFTLDTVMMAQRGDVALATGYIMLSVMGSVAALLLGLTLSRAA